MRPLPDPETLLLIGLIGGITSVVTFILYREATQLGPRLESPGLIESLRKAIDESFG